ncbi:DUF4040 domain-containing protein [Wolbachia endosymbiont of Pentidionis agamae]|uniref:DUF4040 domain-containing protein n=1 Tax=Wolbachia endosymbiont of Pentidionis agamae TaxID=3110435 RepID=UPI002FD67F8E
MVISWFNIILPTLLLVISFAILISNNLVINTILVSLFSLFIACTYVLMSAPDVAITEASVGAGLSTIFMFEALSLMKKKETQKLKHNIFIIILMIVIFLCLFTLIQNMPHFGEQNAPIHNHVAPYYIENTKKVADVPNIVTVILASFRGYDTLCETIVVFTAAVCVTVILKEEKND